MERKIYIIRRRVTLIKSVISSISLYYMSLFKMSVSVINIIIRMQREFLWGWGHEGRRIAWVEWENTCKTKEESGLGIKDLRMFNMAILGKWKWRWRGEPGLWKEVLLSKYASWRALDKGIDGNYNSWWWRDIRKICGGRQITNWFDRNIIWKMGIRNKIKFWEDR